MSRAARHATAAAVSASVGAFHHPQTAAERAPPEIRTSSEIWKKRSILAAAVAPERFMWVFYRAPGRLLAGRNRPLPVDCERVFSKQLAGGSKEAHEVAAGRQRLQQRWRANRKLRDAAARGIHHFTNQGLPIA